MACQCSFFDFGLMQFVRSLTTGDSRMVWSADAGSGAAAGVADGPFNVIKFQGEELLRGSGGDQDLLCFLVYQPTPPPKCNENNTSRNIL